ncbi:DUF5615 family PIN-like protein [Leptospira sp. 201903074]|uniref:DUF5615 family PIN-like protein n=1 Tax=Leptospira abararensis TaxID=2810036 RepID=UPI001965AEA1|nr:DUF5615 family PIN-like protein [Leptospira abararensis]MBM9547404.1 DUF5615 family PIN-like protein [Leptospira abararensis]
MQVKILADENVDFRLIKFLRNSGPTVFSVLEEHKGISDIQVINLAISLKAVILTLDKDFGEWVFSHKEYSNGIIFLRYSPNEYNEIFKALNFLLQKNSDEIYGKFIVLSKSKVRIRDIHL